MVPPWELISDALFIGWMNYVLILRLQTKILHGYMDILPGVPYKIPETKNKQFFTNKYGVLFYF